MGRTFFLITQNYEKRIKPLKILQQNRATDRWSRGARLGLISHTLYLALQVRDLVLVHVTCD